MTFSVSHPVAEWPRPLAFVLSGGGSYGASQVGMLRALEEAAIVPDLVVGSSVGALNGAMIANDPRGAGRRLTEAWEPIRRRMLVGRGGAIRTTLGVLRHLRHGPGLCPPTGLTSLIENWLTVDHFSALATPLAVVVTDAETGDPVTVNSGRLAPALLASAAIPGVFPPVEIDDRLFIDGGVSANVPIRQAIAAGAKSVVVLNANPADLAGKRPTTVAGSLLHASAIMLRSQRADAVDDLAPKHPILNLPQTTPSTLNSFDFSHSAALIDSAHRRSTQMLDALSDSMPFETDSMPPLRS